MLIYILEDTTIRYLTTQEYSMEDDERHFGQKLFDNIFFWLAVGIAMPLVFYFAWGLIELYTLGEMPDYQFGG